MAKGKYARKRLLKQLRDRPINETELSARTVKVLETFGIKNMADLYAHSEEQLKAISGIGEKAMEEIRAVRKSLK